MKQISLKIIALFLISGSVFGLYQNIRGTFQKNVYVWKETGESELPIYCVDTKEKVISFTFDVAWGNEDIDRVLKILKKEKVTASFFFSGDWMSRYPEDVKKIAKAGHDIGNHGDNHKYMTKLSKEEQKKEIQGAHDKAKAILGYDMDLFRPPYGDYNGQVIKTAKEMGYYSMQWNCDSLDWQEPGIGELIDRVVNHKNLKNGSIVLLHTGTKCTEKALGTMIEKLKGKGYQFLPVSKLIYRSNFRINLEGKQIPNSN